jgi:hypothetical protein
MSAFNVLKTNHFMLGIDFHDALIPPEPEPGPTGARASAARPSR